MVVTAAERLQAELNDVGIERFTSRDYKVGQVVHVVLFRYEPSLSDATRQEVLRRFLSLAETQRDGAPYLVSITGGPPVGGEALDAGFEHGFVVTFASVGDRNFYVGEPVISDSRFFDPAHADFKRFVGPLLAPGGVIVFDVIA